MDVEKTIQFLLEHHARFSAEIQELRASTADLERASRRHDSQIAENASHISQLTTICEDLARGQIGLRDAQRATDERLNALIKIVDEIVRGRNGRGM